MAGEIYFPFLLANAEALSQGRERFSLDLPEGPYAQGVFKYQMRCLEALRQAYAALTAPARRRVDAAAETYGFVDALSG